MSRNYVFTDLGGKPCPHIGVTEDGQSRVKADNNIYFDLQQAERRFKWAREDLVTAWDKAFAWLLPADDYADDEPAEPKEVAVPGPSVEVRPDAIDWIALSNATSKEAVRKRRANIARHHLYPHLNAELWASFADECERRGVDPVSRLIIPKQKWNYDTGKPELILMVTLAYLRARGVRSGEWAGTGPAMFLDEDGKWYEGWPFGATRMPRACRIAISRKGVAEAVFVIVYWSDIAYRANFKTPVDAPAPPAGMETTPNFYEQSPLAMLQKCAEAASWRAAFPELFDGLYTSDEIRAIRDQGEAEHDAQREERRRNGPNLTNFQLPPKADGYQEQWEEVSDDLGDGVPRNDAELHAALRRAGMFNGAERRSLIAFVEGKYPGLRERCWEDFVSRVQEYAQRALSRKRRSA